MDADTRVCVFGETVPAVQITHIMQCQWCGTEQYVCQTHGYTIGRKMLCEQEGCLRYGVVRPIRSRSQRTDPR